MDKMKRYEDFKNESNDTDYLTKEELEKQKVLVVNIAKHS